MGWFSSVKKVLSPESKERKYQTNKSKKKWFGKQKRRSSDSTSPAAAMVPEAPLPEEAKLTCLEENEESSHAHSSAIATTTAKASKGTVVTAFEAPNEIVRPTTATKFSGKLTEEVAAIKIQTAFRRYLARRALRALRGLVRLRSLMGGSVVKRQTANTLRYLHILSRVQSQIQSRRVRMMEENQALQKQLVQKCAKELENLRIAEEWDDSLQSKEQIEAKLLNKYEAAMRRERALAYSFSHQQTWKHSSRSINPMFMDPTNPTWGWSWMERCIPAQPLESPSTTENDRGIASGVISKSYARYQLNCEINSPTASQKTSHSTFRSPSTPLKPDSSPIVKKSKPTIPKTSSGAEDVSKSLTSMQSDIFRRHSIGGSGSSVKDDESLSCSLSVPSYMVPTKSARAKSRLQSPLGEEKNGNVETGSLGSVKKRLSFPLSPARPRRHSVPPKLDISINSDNYTSNGLKKR